MSDVLTEKKFRARIAKTSIPLHVDQDDVIHIGNTRLTLDIVIAMFQRSATAEKIFEQSDKEITSKTRNSTRRSYVWNVQSV